MMTLIEVSHSSLVLTTDNFFVWFAKVRNDGNCVWKKGEIVIVVLSEPFANM